MTDRSTRLGKYFNRLDSTDRRRLHDRLERHRERLEAEGYQLSIAEGEHGFFAGVLVIDDERGRVGFLEESGSVSWLGEADGIGGLGTAVVQNPTEELEREVEGLDNVDVE